MKEIKLLGVSLPLHHQSNPDGWKAQLDSRKLEEILDELAKDFPTRSDDELADMAENMITEICPELTATIYFNDLTDKLCGHVTCKERIVACAETATLTVTHLGWTIRRLQAAAAECDFTVRKWNILLQPQQAVIGQVLLKKVQPKEKHEDHDLRHTLPS
jgi:hypothetical protein